MGQAESTSTMTETETKKKQIDIVKKVHHDSKFFIPYKQLAMIHTLQQNFSYEIKGTFTFNKQKKLTGFEIRTDSDRVSSTGSLSWNIFFHTHPDETSQKIGLRYFSPPSVEDIMEIYDRSEQFVRTDFSDQRGEISIVIANEGVYIMQVDRKTFREHGIDNMSDEERQDMLEMKLMPLLIVEVREGILKKNDKVDFKNTDMVDVSYDDFIKVIKRTSKKITSKFGFHMDFKDWNTIERSGLYLSTNTYFMNIKNDD